MEFKIPFSGRAHAYTDEEVATVVETMQTASPLTQGKYLKAFEDKFSRYIGAKNAFAVCNATCGLEMAAQLCQFQQGDEIIAPLHTFTSSVYPFLKKGAKVVWADIDLKTHVVTPETIAPKITVKTRAIVVVHLYGYGVDMPGIMKLAKKHKLIVIEDAAQSLGVDVNGKSTGVFGDIGVFSFHSHKNFSTLGEGGMITTTNDSMESIIPMLRHNGHTAFEYERKDYWIPAMGDLKLPQLDGNDLWPNNYCLGEVECALGVKLLDRIDEINREKRNRAIRFIDALDDFPELEWHRVDSSRHNYHLLVARLKNGRRDDFIRKIAIEKGIQCIVQYYPLNRYPLYQKSGYSEANCPNADNFFDNMVSFPFHHLMTDKEFEYLLQSTHETLQGMKI
jgi:perosamine synthetase